MSDTAQHSARLDALATVVDELEARGLDIVATEVDTADGVATVAVDAESLGADLEQPSVTTDGAGIVADEQRDNDGAVDHAGEDEDTDGRAADGPYVCLVDGCGADYAYQTGRSKHIKDTHAGEDHVVGRLITIDGVAAGTVEDLLEAYDGPAGILDAGVEGIQEVGYRIPLDSAEAVLDELETLTNSGDDEASDAADGQPEQDTPPHREHDVSDEALVDALTGARSARDVAHGLELGDMEAVSTILQSLDVEDELTGRDELSRRRAREAVNAVSDRGEPA